MTDPPRRPGRRIPPGSTLYDRVVPFLLVILGLVLIGVVAVVALAVVGILPGQ